MSCQVPFPDVPSQSHHCLSRLLHSLDPRLSYGFSVFASQNGSLSLIAGHMSQIPRSTSALSVCGDSKVNYRSLGPCRIILHYSRPIDRQGF